MNLWPAIDGPEVRLLMEQHGDDPKWLAFELAKTRYERQRGAEMALELRAKLKQISRLSEG